MPKLSFSKYQIAWFPHGLENLGKTFQSGKSQGILNRLEKSGNFIQNTGKSEGNLPKILEKSGNFSPFFFSDLSAFVQ